jgi:hypothetical protein
MSASSSNVKSLINQLSDQLIDSSEEAIELINKLRKERREKLTQLARGTGITVDEEKSTPDLLISALYNEKIAEKFCVELSRKYEKDRYPYAFRIERSNSDDRFFRVWIYLHLLPFSSTSFFDPAVIEGEKDLKLTSSELIEGAHYLNLMHRPLKVEEKDNPYYWVANQSLQRVDYSKGDTKVPNGSIHEYTLKAYRPLITPKLKIFHELFMHYFNKVLRREFHLGERRGISPSPSYSELYIEDIFFIKLLADALKKLECKLGSRVGEVGLKMLHLMGHQNELPVDLAGNVGSFFSCKDIAIMRRVNVSMAVNAHSTAYSIAKNRLSSASSSGASSSSASSSSASSSGASSSSASSSSVAERPTTLTISDSLLANIILKAWVDLDKMRSRNLDAPYHRLKFFSPPLYALKSEGERFWELMRLFDVWVRLQAIFCTEDEKKLRKDIFPMQWEELENQKSVNQEEEKLRKQGAINPRLILYLEWLEQKKQALPPDPKDRLGISRK